MFKIIGLCDSVLTDKIISWTGRKTYLRILLIVRIMLKNSLYVVRYLWRLINT